MTYNGTHFNTEAVLKMTKKQFLLVGGRGNSLTQEQLAEFYDLAKKKDENYRKFAKGRPVTGPDGDNG